MEAVKEAICVSWQPAVLTAASVIPMVGEIPWVYIPAALLVLLAVSMHCLNTYDERKWRNNIKDRFVFNRMRYQFSSGKKAQTITSAWLGIEFCNNSTKQVRFRIDHMHTKISHSQGNQEWFAPDKPYSETEFAASPGGFGWFDDHPITIQEGITGEVTAEIDCRVYYGQPGQLKHSMVIRKYAVFYAQPPEVSRAEWYDLPLT